MTLSDLTHLAQATLTASSIEERAALGQALAQGFKYRFVKAPAVPCGAKVTCNEDDEGKYVAAKIADYMEPDEADGVAVALLRAADAARAEEE